MFGCPNTKASYPFDIEKFKERQNNMIPSGRPYSIDQTSSSPTASNGNNTASTASPNSVYYKGGMVLYPSLAISASAPSRSPSPKNLIDQNEDKANENHIGQIDLETVDNQIVKIVTEYGDEKKETLLTIHSTDSETADNLLNFGPVGVESDV